jgi:acetyl esterase/lipase
LPLAPAVIVTGQFDDVALGGQAWAAKLREAGIQVVEHSYPMTHTVFTPLVYRRMIGAVAHDLEILFG